LPPLYQNHSTTLVNTEYSTSYAAGEKQQSTKQQSHAPWHPQRCQHSPSWVYKLDTNTKAHI